MLYWRCCYVPVNVVAELDIAAAAAATAAVSAMLGKCHKFVVCTRPRSKLKHSRTEAPTELRRVTIDDTIAHLSVLGSYFSTEFSDEEPSFPPSA